MSKAAKMLGQDEDSATQEKMMLQLEQPLAQQERDRQRQYGIACVRVPCFGRCAIIYAYLPVFYIFVIIQGIQAAYSIGVVTTLEKRFALPSSLSAIIVSSSAMGYIISIIPVSYLARKVSKPKVFAVAALVNALAGVLTATPHFIYGSGVKPTTVLTRSNGSAIMQPFTSLSGSKFCSKVPFDGYVNVSSNSAEDGYRHVSKDAIESRVPVVFNNSEDTGACKPQTDERNFNLPAYLLLILGDTIQGISNSPLFCLGVTHIDECLPSTKAPIFVGIFFGLRLLAPVLAYLLSAYCLSFYVDFSKSNLTMFHPQWVGAWWVGYIGCAVASLILSVLLLGFPEDMRIKVDSNANVREPRLEEKREKPKGRSEFVTTLVSLSTNFIFMFTIAAMCVGFLAQGFIAFLPKYFELHFRQPASIANILAGVATITAASFASFLSGVLAARLNLSVSRTLLTISLMAFMGAVSFATLIAFVCPEINLGGSTDGNSLNFTMGCNAHCDCQVGRYDPVCGPSGVTYYSPCHAGCVDQAQNSSSFMDRQYTNCRCEPGAVVKGGSCGSGCSLLWPYISVLFVTYFVSNLILVPIINVILRSTSEKDRSTAMGIAGFIMAIIFFPAPIVYGALVDSTCKLFHKTCTGRGACQVYNLTMYRYKVHGLSAMFVFLSAIVYLCTWLYSRRRERKIAENDPNETPMDSNTDGKQETEAMILPSSNDKVEPLFERTV